MQHITGDTPVLIINHLPHVLTYSITEPGWKQTMDFDEESLETAPGLLACRNYGCKVYRHRDGETRVVFHNDMYGCPLG